MILHVDHIGLVARSLEEASDLFLETLGFAWDLGRTPMPDGLYMAQEHARIYFIQVGTGETQIELLLPQDEVTGMGRWLAKHGPSVHHVAYMVDDVETHARELVGRGLERIDMGPDAGAAFFYPRSTMGILTELVDGGTLRQLRADATGSVPADRAGEHARRASAHDLAEHARHDHAPGTTPHLHTHAPTPGHGHH